MIMQKKNSIKRAQSQARLSFAERKNFRLQAKHKILLTLVALFAMTTGAWAGKPATVFEVDFSSTPTATTGSMRIGNMASTSDVKINQSANTINTIRLGAAYSYSANRYISLKPETGSFQTGDTLLIAVCYTNSGTKTAKADIYAANGTTLLFTTAPGINGQNESGDPVVEKFVLEQDADSLLIGRSSSADIVTYVTTLKVLRPAADQAIELTKVGANQWTLGSTPDYDVELEVTYFNATAPTANTTAGDIHAGTATPLINAASTTEEGATMKYLVTATNEQPTSTDGFSADVPTAQAITGPGTYYVWYYLDFESGDDSDISPTAIQVTVADYLNYTVSLAEGTADADKWAIAPADATDPEKGVKPGTEITLTYSGTKRVKSVKAVKEPEPKPSAEATAEDLGKLIGTDGTIYADVAAAPAAGTTAVAKIIYIGTTGHATYSHGLALALTDEASKMAWEAAIAACSAKNTSTPVTGATWLLASQAQWDYMLGTDGAGSHYDLRDGFSSVGGSNLQWNYYWSSTEDDSDSNKAWYYYFASGVWLSVLKGSNNYVRACLAF